MNYTELTNSRGAGYYSNLAQAIDGAKNNDVLVVKVNQYLGETVEIDKRVTRRK